MVVYVNESEISDIILYCHFAMKVEKDNMASKTKKGKAIKGQQLNGSSNLVKSEKCDEIPDNDHVMDELKDGYFDNCYKKTEMEDATTFGNDAWLKHCVEMEEPENKLEIKTHISAGEKISVNILLEGEHREGGEKKKTRVQNSKRTCSKDKQQTKYVVESGDIEESARIAAKLDKTRIKRKSNKRNIQKTKRNFLRNSSFNKEDAEVSLEAATGLCTFKCPQCSLEFGHWKKLGKHMKDKHGIVVSVTDPTRYVLKATVHVCRICLEKVFCDSKLLFYHFKHKHRLKLTQYRQQYGCATKWQSQQQDILKEAGMSHDTIGNLCTFRCPLCRTIFYNSNAFQGHHIKSKCPFRSEKQSVLFYIEKVVTHKCKICSKILLCDKTFITRHVSRRHKLTIEKYAESEKCIIEQNSNIHFHMDKNKALLKNDEISKMVGNFCLYACDKCSFVSHCNVSLKRHLVKTGHGCSSKELKNYRSKTVFHECLICRKILLNDWRVLDHHMRRTHQQTASLYVEKFGLTKKD